MSDLPHIETSASSESHSRRHKRKRKTRRKLLQRIIVIGLFILVCGGALAAWHFLVQEPPARTATPDRAAARALKA